MKLQEYHAKRDFHKTPEPHGAVGKTTSHLYLIQKHAASRLHYDFRLAMDGVLKSWAVPKGPSLNPDDKRLAVHVEDHPLDYGSFEGIIPEGEYGGGTVMMWDRGQWDPIGDPHKGYAKGHLRFELKGQRLKGRWALIRMGGRGSDDGKNWLLVKEKDNKADHTAQPTEKFQTSVITRRSMSEIAKNPKRTWSSNRASTSDVKPIASASTLPFARRAAFPTSFHPQLATLAQEAPSGEQWIHEVKYDGYRLLAFVHGGEVRLMTRNEQDWTDHFATVAKAVGKLDLNDAILDGEVVVQKEDGTTDFQALQNALKNNDNERLVYYVFDLPFCDGYDLAETPLIERKRLLKHYFEPEEMRAGGAVRYSDHIEGKGAAVFQNACHYALEGIVSKNMDSGYHQRRTADWLKVKCTHRQEFVVGGYTAPRGTRQHFGSLLLGTYDADGRLVYAGHVGTGFSDTLLTSLIKQLQRRRTAKSPFGTRIEDKLRREVVWVKPELVAEVQFAGWTNDRVLRHPSFEGLREDKDAREVVLEEPKPTRAVQRGKADTHANKDENTVAGVALTHPDRVLYPEQGVTKRELCRYYESVAEHMLPHIKGRPISLVRCPRGEGEACFFQKHFHEAAPESIRGIAIKEKASSGKYILVDDVTGLVSLVQLGALEFHPWPCTEADIEHPDRLIFDLDPAPDVGIKELVTAARLVREFLKDRGLTSFLKTTGGKGLHVVAPVQPGLGWDDFKEYAGAVARAVVDEHPERYVATMSKAKRAGKIFIDYFRNGRGATSVAPYSTRARKGATVSMPIAWDELSPRLKLDHFNVRTAAKHMAASAEAWRDFLKVKQRIPRGAA